MTDYHFVSTWRLQAPIDHVWEEIFHTERWPSWWKDVHRVDQLDPGDAHGLGKRLHLVFTTRLPYRLGFDIHLRRIQPPTILEADATGELEGVGRWTLTPADGGTLLPFPAESCPGEHPRGAGRTEWAAQLAASSLVAGRCA